MIRNVFLGILFCCFSFIAKSQEALSFTLSSQQKGDTLEVTLRFNVAAGMHVYAPSNLNEAQGYITMKLLIDSIPAGLQKTPQIEWPASSNMNGGDIYAGDSHVIIIRFPGKATHSNAHIKGTLIYQACNESICFPPEEKEFSIEMKQVKGGKSKEQRQ